jgi:hypothetical protein
VTRHPTDAWAAQQLRDNDGKYGLAFSRVAQVTGITELRTAYRTPRQNAICERFLGSGRRDCLDHLLILGEAHLRRILCEYVSYFNGDRPHQGLAHRVPDRLGAGPRRVVTGGSVRASPTLGGLHHVYARAAWHWTDFSARTGQAKRAAPEGMPPLAPRQVAPILPRPAGPCGTSALPSTPPGRGRPGRR